VFIIGWVDKGNVIHTLNGIPLALRKKEILPSITTWMELKGIVLTETSQTQILLYLT
jgi:hypothetical protein